MMISDTEERAARRALFTDTEWELSWRLAARPWQLEPSDPEWYEWLITGPRAAGKTYAALHWAADMLAAGEPGRVICVWMQTMAHADAFASTLRKMATDAVVQVARKGLTTMPGGLSSGIREQYLNTSSGGELLLTGGDRIFSASWALDITHLVCDEYVAPLTLLTRTPNIQKIVSTYGDYHYLSGVSPVPIGLRSTQGFYHTYPGAKRA